MTTLDELFFKHTDEFRELLQKPTLHRSVTETLVRLIDDTQVKAIVGPRRAGKSTVAISAYKKLFRTKKEVLTKVVYLNFDDSDLLSFSHTAIEKKIRDVSVSSRYLLFDEIQNLPQWELLLNSLQRKGFKCVVTGSNANLLSKELSTHLTGRHIEIELLPFSFSESIPHVSFNNFYERGGFPEIILNKKEPLRDRLYLESLVHSVLYKDIATRYHIRNFQELERTAQSIINNMSCALSMTGLKSLLGLKSDITVKKYIQYMTDAYLLLPLAIFSYNYKVQIRNLKKFYLVDVGIYSYLNTNTSRNDGKILENFVLLELLKSGLRINRELFYYKTKAGKEVDFLIKNPSKIVRLIQVSFSMSAFETKVREYESLVEASNELACDELIVVTMKEDYVEVYKGKRIQVTSVKKFLTLHTVYHRHP